MLKLRFFFSAAFLVLTATTADINIWEPASLRNLYKSKTMEYTIANFGTVPYGHSVYGTVFKATPLDACTDLAPLKWDKNSGTLIMYVERGNCHFAQKVLMAQKVGAGLVIIGDTDNEDVSKILPVEKTVELMDKIKIPSILIAKSDADNFRNLLINQQDSHQTITLAIHFPLVKAYNVSSIRMILQADDFRSYDAILNLDKYHKAFEGSMDLTVHYKVFKNMPLVSDPQNCVQTANSYCVVSTFPDVKNVNVLGETLRQMCLFDHGYSEFINYIKAARKSCFNGEGDVITDFGKCMDAVYLKTVSQAARDVLVTCHDVKSQKATELFDSNDDNIKYYLINFSPIVFINGYIYKGNYDDSNHLMEAFCSSFEIAPSGCSRLELFAQYKDFSSSSLFKFMIITVSATFVVGLAILAIFYFLYRKKLSSSFDTELNSKISQAMAKYYGDKNDDYKGIKRDEE